MQRFGVREGVWVRGDFRLRIFGRCYCNLWMVEIINSSFWSRMGEDLGEDIIIEVKDKSFNGRRVLVV